MIISATGSRSIAAATPAVKQAAFAWVTRRLIVHRDRADGDLTVLSGGATGWDHCVANAAAALGIPYILIIPSVEYPVRYWSTQMPKWERMVAGAAGVHYIAPDIVAFADEAGTQCLDPHTGRPDHVNKVRNHFLLGGWDRYPVDVVLTLAAKIDADGKATFGVTSGTKHGVSEAQRHGAVIEMCSVGELGR